ncbi:MAG: hypothetical protein M0Q41_08735 [Bacteroidales bacterium]|nr:hypothetical protein [Bacteroidales bacterium]
MKQRRRFRCRPTVPKRFLFFIGAVIWAYAAYRVSKLALKYISDINLPVWLTGLLGLVSLAVFFRFVFLNVSRRYIQRIRLLKAEKPCVFAFFGWKSYLLILLMIFMGVIFAKYEVIPYAIQGIFYIALSGSLCISALMFLKAGIDYKKNTP